MVYNKEKELDKNIEGIIEAYKTLVWGIDKKARTHESRAYGGIIRAGKGKLVESIAQTLIESAWEYGLNQDLNRLKIDRKKIKVPIKDKYIETLDKEIRDYIKKRKKDYYYNISMDLHTYIDGKLVLAVECKSYTENAMMKRILVDASLIKEATGINNFILLQLESQLGGDYSELKDICYGSTSTHTLLSYFDVNLDIITLLKGERKVDEPIHKKGYHKELKKESLYKAIDVIIEHLKDYK